MEPLKSMVGQLLNSDAQRDAIHVAIMPVIVDEDYLQAGMSVKIKYGTKNLVKEVPERISQGVIDPFYESLLKRGDRCWMFLKPGTIQGLRHEWMHEGIDHPRKPRDENERWLMEFADKWNFDYDEMIASASATSTASFDTYITAQGKDLHSSAELGADHELFWAHLGQLKGKEYTAEHKKNFGWSCSC